MADEEFLNGQLGCIGRQRSNSAPCSDQPFPLDSDARASTAAAGGARSSNKPSSRSINVVARFRPENAQELANGGETVVSVHPDNQTLDLRVDSRFISIPGDDKETHQFRFDRVFPSYSTQMDMWSYMGDAVIDNVIAGVNSSVLAYGQTGSGKTYSMMGDVDSGSSQVRDNPGLIPRIFTGLFQRLESMEMSHEWRVEINFVELYMEKLYDLLGESAFNRTQAPRPQQWRFVDTDGNPNAKLEVRDGGHGTTFISGCRTAVITGAHEAMDVVQYGLKSRATAATGSNLQSSRSHAIVLVTLVTKDLETKIESRAQLYLVDLAGSEKVAKTEASGLRLDEATSINLSLHALGNVITALSLRKTSRKNANMHVPFRNSKLTRLLENSLGGNALTFVVLTCSPNSFNDAETLATLRFGAKAKLVTTKPKRNAVRSVEELEMLLERSKAEVTDLKSQVELLRRQLRSGGGGDSGGNNNRDGGNTVTLQLASSAPSGGAKAAAAWGSVIRKNEAELTRLISAGMTCPLTGQIFRDPVLCLDGHTYERKAIHHHLMTHEMQSPVTREQVQMSLLVPNQLVRSIVSMCNDGSLLVAGDIGAPTTIFDVADVLGVVLDYLPQSTVLRYAAVCANMARAAYDKYRWRPLIESELASMPAEQRAQIEASTLPAHKVYLMLTRDRATAAAKVQKLQYLTGQSVALYSSSLRPAGKKRL